MDETQVATTFMIPLFSASALTIAVIWLFYGWRVYWLFVTLVTAVAAAIVGWYFVSPHLAEDLRFLAPLLLGIAGGAVAIPLQRVVAFLTTGALGAVVAVAIAVGFCGVALDFTSPQVIAIAAAGFLIAGVPAALFFKFLTVLITSGYGALIAISGVAAIALIFVKDPWEAVNTGTVIGSLVAWTALTTTGVVVQWKSMIIHKAQTTGST